MSATVDVSICIPVFNGGRTLEQTLCSAFAQTLSPVEVLLVDNASTDNTISIAERYAARGLRVIRNAENLGFNANFNRAVEAAAGRFVMILSADDVLYPQAARVLSEALNRHPGAAFAFSSADLIDESGAGIETQGASFAPGHVDGGLFLEEMLLRRHSVCLSLAMFRRELVLRAGAFNAAFTNSDFVLQAILASEHAVYYHEQPLGAYRVVADCTGERELYSLPDLLSRELSMIEYLFSRLDGRYAHYRRRAELRWVRFTEKMLVLASLRYGRGHARAMLADILRHRPWHIVHPRLMVSAAAALALPRAMTVRLVDLAARVTGRGGSSMHRMLGTNRG